MANLFELTNRRKRAKEFADRFREGATEAEREYFDQYYQEPSASPLLQRGELTRQLDEGDAIKRQLMARGMNSLQAEDAAQRAIEAEQTEREQLAQHTALTKGPGGISGSGPGSYQDYLANQPTPPKALSPYTDPDTGQVIDESLSPMQQSGLGLDDWAMQRAIEMDTAKMRSAGAAADAAERTLDSVVEAADFKVQKLKAELPSVVANSALLEKVNTALDQSFSILQDPNTDATQKAEAQRIIDAAMDVLGKGGRSTGMPGFGPSGFIDEELENIVQQSEQNTQQGQTMRGDSGSQFRLRPQRVESRAANE